MNVYNMASETPVAGFANRTNHWVAPIQPPPTLDFLVVLSCQQTIGVWHYHPSKAALGFEKILPLIDQTASCGRYFLEHYRMPDAA